MEEDAVSVLRRYLSWASILPTWSLMLALAIGLALLLAACLSREPKGWGRAVVILSLALSSAALIALSGIALSARIPAWIG